MVDKSESEYTCALPTSIYILYYTMYGWQSKNNRGIFFFHDIDAYLYRFNNTILRIDDTRAYGTIVKYLFAS